MPCNRTSHQLQSFFFADESLLNEFSNKRTHRTMHKYSPINKIAIAEIDESLPCSFNWKYH